MAPRPHPLAGLTLCAFLISGGVPAEAARVAASATRPILPQPTAPVLAGFTGLRAWLGTPDGAATLRAEPWLAGFRELPLEQADGRAALTALAAELPEESAPGLQRIGEASPEERRGLLAGLLVAVHESRATVEARVESAVEPALKQPQLGRLQELSRRVAPLARIYGGAVAETGRRIAAASRGRISSEVFALPAADGRASYGKGVGTRDAAGVSFEVAELRRIGAKGSSSLAKLLPSPQARREAAAARESFRAAERGGVLRADSLESASPLAAALSADASPRGPPAALPKSVRHAMTAAVADRLVSPTAVKHTVILGGGPAGMMSALTLLKKGARVTIVEQREQYDRPIHFNVRQSLLDQLAYYDPALAKKVLERLGTIERVEFIDATIDKTLRNPPAGVRRPDGAGRIASGRQMMESPSVGQIWVSDLESILYEHLKAIQDADARSPTRSAQPRVTFLRNHQAELEDAGDGKKRVRVQRVALSGRDINGRSRRERVGQPIDIGVPELVIVAEGAGSATRAELGLKVNPTSPETRFIAASFNFGSGGVIRRRYDELADPLSGKTSGVRQILVGHAKRERSWVLVEVPEHLSFSERDQIVDFYLQQAALITQRPEAELRAAMIGWGPNLFRLQQNIVESAVAAKNVILIGDTVGNAHFLTSGGVMTASVPHQAALDRLLDDIAQGRADQTGFGFHRYNAWARSSTLEWMRLGIREFGKQVAAVNFGAAFTRLIEELRRAEGKTKVEESPQGPSFLSITDAERALEGHPQGEDDAAALGAPKLVPGRTHVNGFSAGERVIAPQLGEGRIAGFYDDGRAGVTLEGESAPRRYRLQDLARTRGTAYGFRVGDALVEGGVVAGFFADATIAVRDGGRLVRRRAALSARARPFSPGEFVLTADGEAVVVGPGSNGRTIVSLVKGGHFSERRPGELAHQHGRAGGFEVGRRAMLLHQSFADAGRIVGVTGDGKLALRHKDGALVFAHPGALTAHPAWFGRWLSKAGREDYTHLDFPYRIIRRNASVALLDGRTGTAARRSEGDRAPVLTVIDGALQAVDPASIVGGLGPFAVGERVSAYDSARGSFRATLAGFYRDGSVLLAPDEGNLTRLPSTHIAPIERDGE